MLQRIVIDGYQRIAYADIDLTQAPINVFVGDNEAGKSSIKEAVAFALRGTTPRVEFKKDYEELVYRGKKNGSVSLAMDGFEVFRTIKSGKMETAAPLDYPELLVDLQLGVVGFGEADPVQIRRMLNTVFKLEAPVEFIKQRLKAKGVTDDMLARTLPLIKAGGFESASEAAKQSEQQQRGAWSAITGETYGSTKAKGWKAPDMDSVMPITDAAVAKQEKHLADSNALVSVVNKKLGALEEAARQAEVMDDGENISIDDLNGIVAALTAEHAELVSDTQRLRDKRDQELIVIDTELSRIEKAIDEKKMAMATLECPHCGEPLKLHTDAAKKISLTRADAAKKSLGPPLSELQAELDETKSTKVGVQQSRSAKIRDLEIASNRAQQQLAAARERLTAVTKAADVRRVTPDEIAEAADAVAEAENTQLMSSSALLKIKSDRLNYEANVKRAKDAAVAADLCAQWGVISDALSNKPDSIPSELAAKTMGPINETLANLCLVWNQPALAMDARMMLRRGDGMAYNQLSESARWRADASMQLALAKLSNLKLVILDRFDVVAPAARGDFFDMLSTYAIENPDISVLVMGTLRAKPDDESGLRFHWIEGGVVVGAPVIAESPRK